MYRCISILAAVMMGAPASAAIVTTLPGATPFALPSQYLEGAGPRDLGPFTFTSTTGASVVGQLPGGSYGFSNNGSWTGRLIGLGVQQGSFTLTFDGAVKGFLADVNYAFEPSFDVTAKSYDSTGELLDTILFAEAARGNSIAPGVIGFSADRAIKSIVFSNGFIAIRGISLGVSAGVVPEPASWATMAMGFGLLGGVLRRRRRSVLA